MFEMIQSKFLGNYRFRSAGGFPQAIPAGRLIGQSDLEKHCQTIGGVPPDVDTNANHIRRKLSRDAVNLFLSRKR